MRERRIYTGIKQSRDGTNHLLITSELASQCARKALFTCVVDTKSTYLSLYNLQLGINKDEWTFRLTETNLCPKNVVNY